MRTILTVAGTHGYDDPWRRKDSPLCRHLVSSGVAIEDGFVWSTDLGGVGFGSSDLRGWEAAGVNLDHFVVPPRCPDLRIPGDDLVFLCHSHGLQPCLFACARGVKVDTLVSVCSPVREDLMQIARLARPNIRRWIYIHGGRRDRWGWLGALFDGHIGIRRAHPLADENIACPEADHNDPLTVEALFPLIGRAVLPALTV